jgi:hypothetical protein
MTISLTAFVLWEVTNVAYIGYQSFKGTIDAINHTPRWYVVGWVAAMVVTLATALPAIVLSVSVYIRGLYA